MDIDNIIFNRGDFMAAKKKDASTKEVSDNKVSNDTVDLYGIGLDVGTGYLCGAGYKDGKVDFKPLRNAFYSMDKETFSRNMFNKQKMKFVELGGVINIIGEDALTLSRIQNMSAKRPLSAGVINNREKSSAPILKKMFEYCVKDYIKKEGEICVFSIPGPKVGDENFDVDFHTMSIESLLSSYGLKPVALNEAYAVILSELENRDIMKDVTGLGFSFGAGLVNVAFVYKSMLLFSFSIDKSGDFIDKKSADTCGISESVMNHLKEKELDLSKDEMSMKSELRTLKFTYKYIIKNALNGVMNAFNRNDTVNIVDPVPIIISGGTTIPNGFDLLFKSELDNISLPFTVTKVITASNRLGAVAKGCLVYAKELEENNDKAF